MHHIQKHILRALTHAKYARFSELRPGHIESNLYNYHLKSLLREHLIEKTPQGYGLSLKGLTYIDRVSIEKFEPRQQPKVVTLTVSFNTEGKVLLWQKQKQPFIGAWSIPSGKIHLEDVSILEAAKREAAEKMNYIPTDLRHIGVCTIRVNAGESLVSYVMAHILTNTIKEVVIESEFLRFHDESERTNLQLAPAAEAIIQRTSNGQGFFYEAYDISL